MFLHISHDEQRERFRERYDDPYVIPADRAKRKRWDDYVAAYEDALSETSTDYAPWYVIPADRNWFRNLCVPTVLTETLAALKPDYPPVSELPPDLVIE